MNTSGRDWSSEPARGRGEIRTEFILVFTERRHGRLCSADGSTHTESNKLYRKVKHRYRPNLSPRQRPTAKSAPRSGSARGVGRGAGSHTLSTASEVCVLSCGFRWTRVFEVRRETSRFFFFFLSSKHPTSESTRALSAIFTFSPRHDRMRFLLDTTGCDWSSESARGGGAIRSELISVLKVPSAPK